MDKAFSVNPRNGDEIVNVRETVAGYRADLVHKSTGAVVALHGTWAFAPGLSFFIPNDGAKLPAGLTTGYVTVSRYWQY